MTPQAIIDAKENAKLNEITNSEFFTGKAEDILGSICYRATSNDILAVVDPPRAGIRNFFGLIIIIYLTYIVLEQKAVVHLRKVQKINKLVYVACNPAAALGNFIDIGRPASKRLQNDPFVPVRAVAVDMFPHTRHYELIICFERFNKVKDAQLT